MRLGQPGAREGVIGGEGVELVPIVGHRIDMAAVGTEQLAAQLEVVGRIGEDHVDRLVGHGAHRRDAIAANDLVERQHARIDRRRHLAHRARATFGCLTFSITAITSPLDPYSRQMVDSRQGLSG